MKKHADDCPRSYMFGMPDCTCGLTPKKWERKILGTWEPQEDKWKNVKHDGGFGPHPWRNQPMMPLPYEDNDELPKLDIKMETTIIKCDSVGWCSKGLGGCGERFKTYEEMKKHKCKGE